MIATTTGTTAGYQRRLKSILGELSLTSQQAERLDVRSHRQLSPYLETCCLRVSANVSSAHAAEDIAYFTGMRVPGSVQQRLVHDQDFTLPSVEPAVEELSVDGGNIRVRTPQGQPCRWQGYKAVCLHELAVGAACEDKTLLLGWVQRQPLANLVTCLGDGHDGIWNLIEPMMPAQQRPEVLDWFHLMENLAKVGGSLKRLKQAEQLLWRGKVDAAKALFTDCKRQQAHNFCHYLDKHRHRIINYEYHQAAQICAIGSGAVEATVKQIERRTKISGAQWKRENVPQVLAHRCAYLNGLLFT